MTPCHDMFYLEHGRLYLLAFAGGASQHAGVSLMLCWFYFSTRLLLYHERLYWTSYVSFSWQFLKGIQLQLAGEILIPPTNSQFRICPSNNAFTDFNPERKTHTKALKFRAFHHQLFIHISSAFMEALLNANNVTAL